MWLRKYDRIFCCEVHKKQQEHAIERTHVQLKITALEEKILDLNLNKLMAEVP